MWEDQYKVNGAEPWIVATSHVLRRVVEKADACRVLENDRPVVRAQLAWVRADGRDLDVLCERRECSKQKGKYCVGDPHVVPPAKFDSFLADPRRAS
jgi:hypothetical protein